ncbi:DUF4386 domain-containing protein [Streptomyces sp. CC77]|uniref:DUF4386 domain-containing protein n=1 Tax=Streptomyces sp. CC77 TaxID=1906739 RepID=UPI0008DE1F90|nr:DUF4386 domain-containing protein [Streptomyces sp. CC77]OII66487.1 hypothetical protein BJP39_08595 [Streptomyces sp. CC77]
MNRRSPQRLARLTGLLFLVIVVCGVFATTALDGFVVAGDAAATAENVRSGRGLFTAVLLGWTVLLVADAAVSVPLYLLLRDVDGLLALLAMAFRLLFAALLGVAVTGVFHAYALLGDPASTGVGAAGSAARAMAELASFDTAFLFGLVVFGVHLLCVGVLLYRSRYVPRALGALVTAGGVAYVVDSLLGLLVAGHGGAASTALLMPAALGELGLTAWLLIKGVTTGRPYPKETV